MGEIIQEIGRDFVIDLKEFLESTENFGSVFTGYNRNQVTVRQKQDGSTKIFDMIASYKKIHYSEMLYILGLIEKYKEKTVLICQGLYSIPNFLRDYKTFYYYLENYDAIKFDLVSYIKKLGNNV